MGVMIAKNRNISTQYKGDYTDKIGTAIKSMLITMLFIHTKFVTLSQIMMIIGFTSFKSAP